MDQGKQKRILVVTPRLPVPPPGACEKDRYYNILQLRDLGYRVTVLAKVSPTYDLGLAREFEKKEGIRVVTTPYIFMQPRDSFFYLRHLLNWNCEVADYEYSNLSTQKVFLELLNEFKPDLIISVHAPYKLVDHDGPISFPNLESPLPVRTLGAFPGSLGTYAGIERNVPVVTPELPSAKSLPDLKAVEQLFMFIMKSKF